jgi:uncharacterized membrane protein
MKPVVKRIAENLLFAADVFIVFLVLFESRMAFPAWLQSVGRMHPMFLHFPIVLLLLAMGMEFFRDRKGPSGNKPYDLFAQGLLLAGTFSAAITVIMGLLLSAESGYSGSTVAWHKWAGLAVVFIASFVYWSRNASWYSAAVSRGISLLAVLCILAAGHLGAGITHGENYISGPLLALHANDRVPVDKAFVYADVIHPIFKAKCMTCHNPDKAKGRLVLDNPEDILKGGKSGRLLIAFHADSSLMMERINLPEEEKKHMPLTGKPQLTKEEKDVLYYWIQSGADFKTKLTDLPETDSLRMAAAKFLAPATEEVYDFAAADEKTISKLNNNYRVIFPIARESPALVVNFYNQHQFSTEALAALLPLKEQIVELNLNKMPVRDADLRVIGQLEHLHTLNLNFTQITDAGLAELAPLTGLRHLFLSGTRISPQGIAHLAGNKNLQEMAVWNTGLDRQAIARLRQTNAHLRFIEGYAGDSVLMQLTPPIMITEKNVFSDTLHVLLKHPIPGVQIRYSLDGSGPDSTGSLLYDREIILDKTSLLQTRAFKPTWLGSDTVSYNFYKSAYRPDSIFLLSPPADSYKGDGPGTLCDRVTGNLEFGSGKWLGFRQDMTLLLQFIKPVELSSVCLHLLRNNQADIYPPVQIEIWGGHDKQHLKLLQTSRPRPSVKTDKPALFLEACRFAPVRVNYVKIVAASVKQVPKWGTSPNKPGWIFIDELLMN